MPTVRTVLGDVDATTLGRTYCHEHLLTHPAPSFLAEGPDMLLDDAATAERELRTFKGIGGGALVEVTTPEFGRNAEGLAKLSKSTGVHIVCSTGHVSEEYWRGVVPVDERTPDDLFEEFVSDLTEGIDGSRVRAGVIKVGSSLDRATAAERRVLGAAGHAQSETGAPITTHTTDGTAALEQVDLLTDSGADASKICVGHLDRRLEWGVHLEVARTGAFLGYDCISKDKYEPDERRIEFILRLVDAGFGERILLSGDMARRSYLEAWGGGPGYRYIIEKFVPRLQASGLDSAAADSLLIDNAARFLSWLPAGAGGTF